MTQQPILSLSGVSKNFGGLQASSNLDYVLHPGEFSALIGSNGAGKSTFFNLITGKYPIDAGEIRYRDRRLNGLRPDQIARLGIARAFQVSNIYPTLSSYENVRQAVLTRQRHTLDFFRSARSLGRAETEQLLEACGLATLAGVAAGTLSQGDKKRLELAVALGTEPDLLLLDEPTAGMSGEESRRIMAFVDELNRSRGLTILFTEHDMALVFGFARRISVLHQGSIIADGLPEDVRCNEMVQSVYLGES